MISKQHRYSAILSGFTQYLSVCLSLSISVCVCACMCVRMCQSVHSSICKGKIQQGMKLTVPNVSRHRPDKDVVLHTMLAGPGKPIHQSHSVSFTANSIIILHYDRRYNTICDNILTCNRKLTWVTLICCTEPTTKKWKNRKTKK